MARPNDAAAIAGHIQGLREAKAAFQALPEIVRDRLNVATSTTASEIARAAKANLLASPSIQTRSLYNHVTWSMNEKNGRAKVGVASGTTRGTGASAKIKFKGVVVGGKLIRPSRYAHLVEKGTRHFEAEPFMLPAAESQTAPYLDRCERAGKQIEGAVAAIGTAGGRLL
jgi:HK97 gp10 family phage protein